MRGRCRPSRRRRRTWPKRAWSSGAPVAPRPNAVNFGSGWFPTLRKPPGLSGFRTVEAALRRRGPWTAGELTDIAVAEVAATFGQDPEHELMGHFARHLRELGERVAGDHDGSFLALARA